MNNTRIRDDELRYVVQCLFEGLTLHMPAFNYLRFVNTGSFNKVNLFSMESDLQKKYDKEQSQIRRDQRP